MKIGIIGTGNVGGTLGKAWSWLGHDVFFGFRDPSEPRVKTLVAEAAASVKAGSVQAVAKASDVILLAPPWEATQGALSDAGNLSGKVLIDATNPLLADLAGLAIGTTTSGGEKVAEWAKGGWVVKAFNTVGFNVMADSGFPGSQVGLFYCGNDPEAKQVVAKLAGELGFEALDAGPLTQCRLLEPFAMLWISLAAKYGYGREIGFKLMRRTPITEKRKEAI